MSVAITCNQQDSSSLNQKDEEMGAAILSGGVEDNPSSRQFGEQAPLMGGPQYQDDVGESEWQIPMLGMLPKPSEGFCNRDFRNPHTGESIVPIQVYADVQREVHQASQPYERKVLLLALVLYCAVVVVPCSIIFMDFDTWDSSSSIYLKIGYLACFVRLVFLLWKTGMQWMNKSLHARMERIVKLRQGTLMECGVELGYSQKITGWYRDRSHLWLRRRIPESQPSWVVDSTPGNPLESTREKEPQHFPPVYINWLMPGDIHINEKEYDPSMVLDQEVWTMIQKAHWGRFKTYHHRYLTILMGVLAMFLVLYSMLLSYFISLLGDLAAWLVFLGLLSGCLITGYILDRLDVEACCQAADKVTVLLNHRNPKWYGTMLKFETSVLPFRNRPWTVSRRYQLARLQEIDPLYSSPFDDDGKPVEDRRVLVVRLDRGQLIILQSGGEQLAGFVRHRKPLMVRLSSCKNSPRKRLC